MRNPPRYVRHKFGRHRRFYEWLEKKEKCEFERTVKKLAEDGAGNEIECAKILHGYELKLSRYRSRVKERIELYESKRPVEKKQSLGGKKGRDSAKSAATYARWLARDVYYQILTTEPDKTFAKTVRDNGPGLVEIYDLIKQEMPPDLLPHWSAKGARAIEGYLKEYNPERDGPPDPPWSVDSTDDGTRRFFDAADNSDT